VATSGKKKLSRSRAIVRNRSVVMAKRATGRAKAKGAGKKTRTAAPQGKQLTRAKRGTKFVAGPTGRKSLSLKIRKGRVMATTGTTDGTGVREVENLDKVKEILFGAEKRDTEQRLKQLEKLLRKELEEMNTQIGRRLDTLEAYAKKEFKSATDELRAEQKARQTSDDDLSKKIAGVDDQLNKSRRDLRDEILDLSKTVRAELAASATMLTKSLANNTEELRDEKTSRGDLAALLVDMALRLNKDVELTKIKK
jgi:hypothetical protein